MISTFPTAHVATLWNDSPGRYPDTEVQESWLSRTPLRQSKAMALPFMPTTWRHLSSKDPADWLLIGSHLFAHHALLRPPRSEIDKFVYVHTPARYIWSPEVDARGSGPIPRLASSMLRPLDRKRAGEHKHVAANSAFVQKRIRDNWAIDSEVIYPPVDVDHIKAKENWETELDDADAELFRSLPKPFILGASRFVPYKKLESVITIGAAANLPVVIAGSGPDEMRLRLLAEGAGVPVSFVVRPSNSLLYTLYQSSLAFVFPPIEDFGIMPVEAMATGTPVLVNQVGGASESVVHARTGMHIDPDDTSSAVKALEFACGIERRATVARADEFSIPVFQRKLHSWMRR